MLENFLRGDAISDVLGFESPRVDVRLQLDNIEQLVLQQLQAVSEVVVFAFDLADYFILTTTQLLLKLIGGRELAELQLVGGQRSAGRVGLHACVWTHVLFVHGSLVLFEELCFQRLLQLGNLCFLAFDLMSMLRLLVLNLRELLHQLLPFIFQFLNFCFMLSFHGFQLCFQVGALSRQLFASSLRSLQLGLGILASSFCSVELLPEFSSTLDVLNALLEHIVNRVDSLLDILRPGLEQVTDCWHTVLHLGLLDVTHLKYQLSMHHIVIIMLLREESLATCGTGRSI